MKNNSVIIGILFVSLFGCKSPTNSENSKKLALVFESKSNSTVTGNATFVEKKGEVIFVAKISGLKPGTHAIHIHEKSDCSSVDGSSAGGHWNPTFKKHGKWNMNEYHKGDIGNFTADASGNGTISLTTDQWCIGCGDTTKDILGKGLIVHQGQDDFVSQPAGDAGPRVACSAIIK